MHVGLHGCEEDALPGAPVDLFFPEALPQALGAVPGAVQDHGAQRLPQAGHRGEQDEDGRRRDAQTGSSTLYVHVLLYIQ